MCKPIKKPFFGGIEIHQLRPPSPRPLYLGVSLQDLQRGRRHVIPGLQEVQNSLGRWWKTLKICGDSPPEYMVFKFTDLYDGSNDGFNDLYDGFNLEIMIFRDLSNRNMEDFADQTGEFDQKWSGETWRLNRQRIGIAPNH